MSHTTTAAASHRRTPLSFEWEIPLDDDDVVAHPNDNVILPPNRFHPQSLTIDLSPNASGDVSPRVNVSSLCRRTFVHLDSASPLAKLSQPGLIRSFRAFSSRLQDYVHCCTTNGAPFHTRMIRRRHTLTPVVVDEAPDSFNLDDAVLVRPSPNGDAETTDLEAANLSLSSIARLSKRHSKTFDGLWKDDSYAPNLRRCPSDACQDKSALLESRELSRSMSEALLTTAAYEGGRTQAVDGVRRLAPLLELAIEADGASASKRAHSTSISISFEGLESCSPMDGGLSTTPTPMMASYTAAFFPRMDPLYVQLHPTGPSASSVGPRSTSPGEQPRSPSKLRPLADLLTCPWDDAVPPSFDEEANSPHIDFRQKPQQHENKDFDFSEWIGLLPEREGAYSEERRASGPSITRGSLSELVSIGSTLHMANIFASPAAQTLLVPAASASDSKKLELKSEDAVATSGGAGHPTACKPCAFFWSKGCLNGDDCRFCHEWHAPKKKKPMKDQKNLMIIARDDGKIAFLRCAIEDALKHQ